MSRDAFGFNKPTQSAADMPKTIQPENRPSAPVPIEKIDAAAEALGFQSRERAGQGVYRRKREIGPTVAINTRAPERVAGPFIQFCELNRFSYWEGIEELMKRAELI